MKITAPYRGRSSSKRPDLTDLRHVLSQGDAQRMWCCIALVQAPAGEQHFEVLADDVHVEVVTQPSLIPLTCRLAAGIWRIPDVGEEVMVLIPEGRIDFMPMLIDVLSSGSVPTTQGPALGTSVLARPSVLIHDGSGGAVPLATVPDLNALKSAIQGWMPVANDGGAALKAALLALFAGPPTWPAGTTVLEAK
ncbi:MAG TPA: hypothetical protein VLN57_21215 [Xanthobacteraceae bacterium]|nr:hypothetical protein [Xanthobacteraceae bacterium]